MPQASPRRVRLDSARMTGPLFASDPREPLSPWIGEDAARALPGTRRLRLEFASRGDRVPGRLLLPPQGRGPFPLILLQHGAGGSKDAPYLDAAAAPWVRGGAAVASLDFPLHGERTSAKLTERVLTALGGTISSDGGEAAGLWVEFVRQAVVDLHRALDVLSELPELDAGRVAYAGFSMGTILGAPFCAEEPRLRAAALAIGGGGFGPAAVDPAAHIGRFAPRPLLFVNATRDERIPRRAAETLHAAAAPPKQVLWFECGHSELPGAALKAMWQFLRGHLELGEPRV